MAKRIEALIAKLERLAQPGFLDGVKREVGIEALKLVQREFDSETDPYGNLWVPTEQHGKRSSGKTLYETGALKGSFTAYPTANGIAIGSRAPYASYHQDGTARLPIRRMLPIASLGMPVTWSKMVERVVIKAIKSVLP